MDGVAASSYKGLRSYFRRRDYQRLDGSGWRRRRRTRVEVATMGGGGPNRPRSRFFIRFKRKLKLKLRLRFLKRLGWPKKFFVRLRDAYVRMMLSFANSTVFTSGLGAAHGGDSGSFGRAPLKEYEEKMILEIYASLMIQRKLNIDNNSSAATTNVMPLMRDRLATVPEISTEQVS